MDLTSSLCLEYRGVLRAAFEAAIFLPQGRKHATPVEMTWVQQVRSNDVHVLDTASCSFIFIVRINVLNVDIRKYDWQIPVMLQIRLRVPIWSTAGEHTLPGYYAADRQMLHYADGTDSTVWLYVPAGTFTLFLFSPRSVPILVPKIRGTGINIESRLVKRLIEFQTLFSIARPELGRTSDSSCACQCARSSISYSPRFLFLIRSRWKCTP